jgi:hypothetical protein
MDCVTHARGDCYGCADRLTFMFGTTAGFWRLSLLADKGSQYLARKVHLNNGISSCCIGVFTLTDVRACTWLDRVDCELDFADDGGQISCVSSS